MIEHVQEIKALLRFEAYSCEKIMLVNSALSMKHSSQGLPLIAFCK